MRLDGDIALVTGASRGLGASIALALAEAGAFVIGTATTSNGAESISTVLGDRGLGKVLDVTESAQVNALVKEVEANHGGITILVNNAGITEDGLLPRVKEDAWSRVIDTNLSSVYRTSKACLRGMLKARRGRIVNISSVVGLSGNAGQASYAASKAGIGGFTRSLAQEVGPRGITVNAVAPGYIDTDMTADLADGVKSGLLQQIPLDRFGTPEDIAKAVLFLVSGDAAYITGETLSVNGGLYTR